MSSKGMQQQSTSGMSVAESKKKGQALDKQEQMQSDQVPHSSSHDNINQNNDSNNNDSVTNNSTTTNNKRQTRSQALQKQQNTILNNFNLNSSQDTALKQDGTDLQNSSILDQKEPLEKGFELHRVSTADDDQDQNYQFYKEYCRLYYANIVLTNRLQHLLNEKQELQFKLNRLESNKRKHEEVLGMTFDIAEEKRKRHRRTATEIARHYRCPIDDCPKSYGSEGSLNQHLKLKHLEFYQQLCSTNQINPVAMSKHGSSLNDDGKSIYSGSYDEDEKSERDDNEDSYGEEQEQREYQQQQKKKQNLSRQDNMTSDNQTKHNQAVSADSLD